MISWPFSSLHVETSHWAANSVTTPGNSRSSSFAMCPLCVFGKYAPSYGIAGSEPMRANWQRKQCLRQGCRRQASASVSANLGYHRLGRSRLANLMPEPLRSPNRNIQCALTSGTFARAWQNHGARRSGRVRATTEKLSRRPWPVHGHISRAGPTPRSHADRKGNAAGQFCCQWAVDFFAW